MNRGLVVKILRKKTHHFATISLIILVVSLMLLNFMFAYLANQYEMINRDYLKNNNVKVIHVDRAAEGNDSSRAIRMSDKEEINQLLAANGLSEKAKAYRIYNVPAVFDSSMTTAYSILGVGEELAFLISDTCTLKDNSICVKESLSATMTIKVPVVEIKDGGYSSNETVDLSIEAESGATSENSIFIHSIPNNNQAYVNENVALHLLDLMFQGTGNSKEYIRESHLEKIIVYVKDIKDVDQVGKLLKNNRYYTSYTFSSFDNFSINISSTLVMLLSIGIVFVLASILTAALLLVNYLRLQKKEVAILKLNGYDSQSIKQIYTRLVFIMLSRIMIVAAFLYCVTSFIEPLHSELKYFPIIALIDLFILLFTFLLVYWFGVRTISRMHMMDLLKKGKEFE
ncbi:hypothetical protein [Paenibacillus xylaniclasticus]|uniref:hypothetical protein n=1 Tax=Paenibacillus xylaniclasticus TaxID=588083 RepID=UPI000FDA429E|nr:MULTISPECIES: hypothetical protein [Paenibacillus]GFN31241.1 hypothetical protein PCURB6_15010 [Paenibacillus curdlanolyticus]